MKTKRKYYSSCEFLPLWNFFKLNNGEKQMLKYLVILKDRLEYEDTEIAEDESEILQEQWEKIFQEYTTLENNFGAVNFLGDKTKILYYYTMYVQEQSILKSLLYRTNVKHIKFLRERGYEISNKSQAEYWQSLYNGIKKVENHLSYIEIVKGKMKSVAGDSKKEGNPFDSIMAWIQSNGIEVREDITVSRYIKIKEIILQRHKAKQQEQSKNKLHGWRT